MGLTGFVIIHVFIASFSPAQGERNQMVNAKFTRPVNAKPMSISDEGGQARPDRGARQLAARHRQAPRRDVRRGHHGAQPPHRHPLRLRARREPQARRLHEGT